MTTIAISALDLDIAHEHLTDDQIAALAQRLAWGDDSWAAMAVIEAHGTDWLSASRNRRVTSIAGALLDEPGYPIASLTIAEMVVAQIICAAVALA